MKSYSTTKLQKKITNNNNNVNSLEASIQTYAIRFEWNTSRTHTHTQTIETNYHP